MPRDVETIRLQVEDNWGQFCTAVGARRQDIHGAAVFLNSRVRRAGGHFNLVLKMRAQLQQYPSLLAQASSLFLSEGLPFSFYESPTPPKSVEGIFRAHGFQDPGPQIYMVHARAARSSRAARTDVRLVTPAEVNQFADAIYASFGWPESTKDGWAATLREALPDERVRPLMAYVGGQRAGGVTLFSTGGIAGIFSVGTLAQYRGRGVATALIRRAVAEARERGDRLLWLRTTREYAVDVYRKLGFQVAYRGVSYSVKR